MSWLDGLRHRFHVLRRGEQYAAEVDRELRFHVELDALANKNFQYLTTTYLPRKLKDKDWLD